MISDDKLSNDSSISFTISWLELSWSNEKLINYKQTKFYGFEWNAYSKLWTIGT